jgi:hypothetical protein
MEVFDVLHVGHLDCSNSNSRLFFFVHMGWEDGKIRCKMFEKSWYILSENREKKIKNPSSIPKM